MDDPQGHPAATRLLRLSLAAGFALLLSVPSVARADDSPVVGSGDCAGTDKFVTVCAVDPESLPDRAPQAATHTKKDGGRKQAAAPALCHVVPLDPQPPVGSALWEGHRPGDGKIYQRNCPYNSGDSVAPAAMTRTFWAKNPPPAKTVDPVVLARQAVDRMKLSGPEIGIAPKPSGKGLVGLPVWMWTARTAEAYGPNSASATAGPVTVTATATVSKIVWDMGDGESVTCTGPGTPYEPSFGNKASPDCGHRYRHSSKDEPGKAYPVTATSTWTIDWRGGGQSGQLTQTRQSRTQVTIGQLKVLN